jgi:3-oxoacyl-[acyl-carrier-protein] synthase-1/3-oxoacyl-[acyl-carrier-protein] synthase II
VSVRIVAWGALSGLGRGEAAFSAGPVGARAEPALRRDEALEAVGLRRPFAARAPITEEAEDDRATVLLASALSDCATKLDAVRPGWREERVGIAVGTSSGGMASAERLFGALERREPVSARVARQATYFGPLIEAFEVLKLRRASPATLLLAACAASTVALGVAARWLERGACDLVLAGGFDALTVFVAAGFEALRATSASVPPQPFGLHRDGMLLGEGGAILALTADDRSPALAWVRGFGAAGDAVHLTAPDREGRGLALAAQRALVDARLTPDAIDLVSAHATATPYNDAAEWRSMQATFGARAAQVPVHALKAQIGHTLGAAGALETLALVDAVVRGVLPATPCPKARDPETPAHIRPYVEPGTVRAGLKLSAAFGGAAAALVVGDAPSRRSGTRRAVWVSEGVHLASVPELAALADATGLRPDRLGRTCELSRLVLGAVAPLAARHEIEGAGVVVGYATATLDVNRRFFSRVLERGATMVEPRAFPYTAPNAAAGECSIAYRLTGPNLAVGAGLHGGLEALAVGCELVAAGDADAMVVVAADAPGPAAEVLARAAGWRLPAFGAVALVVTASPGRWPVLRFDLSLEQGAAEPLAPGHEALLPLSRAAAGPLRLMSRSPQGMAEVELGAPEVDPPRSGK